MSPSFKTTLFVLTVISTFLAGSADGTQPVQGLLFCVSIMGILFAHEMGHYLTCRYYGIAATLPVFIPMPVGPFGTLGAVIRIRSPIPHRRALFDIGVAGPLAGILLAIPISIIGLRCSTIVQVPKGAFLFGDPLILKGLTRAILGRIPPGHDVLVHPMAFAAWVGFFVTALNLLPIGQLDGGHVIYAIFGRKSRYFYAFVVGLVIVLVIRQVLQMNYGIFLAIIFLIGFRHPPTIYDYVPLDRKRKILAVVMLIVFVACFTPYPIYAHGV